MKSTTSSDVLVFDVETTIYTNGAWFDPRNVLCAIAYDDVCVPPSERELAKFQERVNKAKVLVGFNIKFDLHWLTSVGIDYGHTRCYDVQYVEYMLSGQTNKWASLDDTSEKHLGERKHDYIWENYWSKGIQTTDIPWSELSAYAIQDVALTRKLYEKLVVPKEQEKLFSLAMQDLLVLQEIERNGLRYDRDLSLKLAEEYEQEIEKIKERCAFEVKVPGFNWGSPQQISALLFGGSVFRTEKVPDGVFKSGARKGQPKFRNEEREYRLPRRYKPVGLTPSGNPTTDDDTLVKLGTDGIAGEIQSIRRLQKEVSTYLRGIPNRQDLTHCGKEYVYPSYNQCATNTGRLSSTEPNGQNMSQKAQQCIVSRYD